jgi:biotin carboxylase
VLGRAGSYAGLLRLADRAGLGTDLVVQMPYGDSGKTTFFVGNEADWIASAAREPVDSGEIKVMRRIEHRAIAVEAVLTRHGTIVGPLMNDITGHPELTPYRGGWAGNDYPATLTADQKIRARELTRRLGDELARQGYLGFFEVDYLVDTGSGELYLGELNPRISGISSMTNVTAGAYADMPLFLFHLLEFLDLDYEIDVDDINERWSREAAVDAWSQIIIKETSGSVDLLTHAPRSGVYTLGPDGTADFRRQATDWHGIIREPEAFYLRILAPGDFRYKGADLGALVTRGRLQTDDNRLERRCIEWIAGIRGQFSGTPVVPLQAPAPVREGFKMA